MTHQPSFEYASLTSPELEELPLSETTVIVPVGATEQHGRHLPLETDFALADVVARRCAERLTARGTRVLVTPPVWVGFSPHHMAFPGTLTLSAATFTSVITDIATSLWRHGVRKILFLNGHGGNTALLSATVQTLRYEHGVRVAAANYWALATDVVAEWRHSGHGGINHACEMETSLMAAARPHSVRSAEGIETFSDPGLPGLVRDLTDPGSVTVALSFDELSADGSLGAWKLADADRGENLLDAIVNAVAGFVQEFSEWVWPGHKEDPS